MLKISQKIMFTGIIQEIGKIEKVLPKDSLTQLGISSKTLWKDSRPSDSIAVNGVCLTLIYIEKQTLFFEAVKPTFQKTNLKRVKKGSFVNLEPALKMGDKLGGHFVLGHVDAEVKLKRAINKRSYHRLEISLPSQFRKYIISNGSVALEGISLTVKDVLPSLFTVDIVPFSYDNTNLKYKRPGDWLNIEFDYLLKQAK